MTISLTPAAADRVKNFLQSRGQGIGLRLGVRKTGCSGFAYVINYADATEPQDRAKALGPDVLNARLGAATRAFYAAAPKYLTPQTAKGKAAIEAAWVDTLDAKVPPSKGLVLSF